MNYEERDDAGLLGLIIQQDRQALGTLYDRYGKAIYSLAIRLLRDSGAAEEVTQDVFFNVWRRASSYRDQRGKVTAWLFSIAHHRTIDELRRRRRDQTQLQHGFDLTNWPSKDGNGPMEYAASQFERNRLVRAFRSLNPNQREVVVLAYFGGLTHSEIAKKLGQPLGTVKTRMRLGLRKLRQVLGPQMTEQADHGL